MFWKNLSSTKKGAIIGGGICLVLFLLFNISNHLYCNLQPNEFGEYPVGAMCQNSFSTKIFITFDLIGMPISMLGGNPNLSTGGPLMVYLFYVGNFVWFSFLGALIGFVISKLRDKN